MCFAIDAETTVEEHDAAKRGYLVTHMQFYVDEYSIRGRVGAVGWYAYGK